jgi:hypothetical protein
MVIVLHSWHIEERHTGRLGGALKIASSNQDPEKINKLRQGKNLAWISKRDISYHD